jgi:hypothetical protein
LGAVNTRIGSPFSSGEDRRRCRRRDLFPYKSEATLSIAELGSFESLPPPFDDRELRQLFDEHWKWTVKLGQPGEKLFLYYVEVIERPDPTLPALIGRTLEILAELQSSIRLHQLSDGLAYFAAVHRFWARLSKNPHLPFGTAITDFGDRLMTIFEWLVGNGRDSILPHFKIWIPSPTFKFLLAPVTELKQFFTQPIGDFVWKWIIMAVDAGLTNQFMDLEKLTNLDELIKLREPLRAIYREFRISLPMFSEALTFIVDYQRIIRELTPFEDVAPNLPIDFVVAVVFASKRKGLIPLEVSDRRILLAAEYQHVDLADLDHKVLPHERPDAIPVSMWEF